jgi:RNA polymerase sigma-70 factor (ECF subfamily)
MRRITERGLATDEQLLSWSAAGDEAAFTALYRRRQASVYRFALHMSGREDVADEVTQEVFLTLIREPGRFDARRGSVSSYLLGVARNHVLRTLERERGWIPVDDDDAAALASTDADVLGHLTRDEAIDAVRRAVLTLPPAYREAVVLCDLEELSYADAARLLSVPVGTVRSRLNRGRSMLLEKLKAGGSGKNAVRCSA